MSKKYSKKTTENQKITFSFHANHAKEVILMGDFNEWSPTTHPMELNGNSTWQKSVMLSPGKYEYKFKVDGQWVEDANNNQSCSNCFGTCNSIIEIRKD